MFDPHVGDTMCQIRAYKIFILHSQDEFSFYIHNKLESLEVAYSLILEKLDWLKIARNNLNNDNQKKIASHEHLENFLAKEKLIFDFNLDTIFLMCSYFLTRFKSNATSGSTYIDYEKISNELNVSRKHAKKLTRHCQILLSELSVEFVVELWNEFPQQKPLKMIFDYLKYKDDDERTVLPCYPVMKILLSYTFHYSIPIILITERRYKDQSDYVLLFFLKKNYEVKPMDRREFYLLKEMPCIIIQGSTFYSVTTTSVESQKQFIRRFMKIGLAKVLLSYMAVHPQFSGKKLASLSIDPFNEFQKQHESQTAFMSVKNNESNLAASSNLLQAIADANILSDELNKMKKSALQIGSCSDNASLFFVKHIFCDTLNNQVKNVDDATIYMCAFSNKINDDDFSCCTQEKQNILDGVFYDSK